MLCRTGDAGGKQLRMRPRRVAVFSDEQPLDKFRAGLTGDVNLGEEQRIEPRPLQGAGRGHEQVLHVSGGQLHVFHVMCDSVVGQVA